jgi:hypothetical protein
MAFWPEHEPPWNGEPPEEMRLAKTLMDFVNAYKKDGTTPTYKEMISLFGGALIDMEERMVQMQRRLNELGD